MALTETQLLKLDNLIYTDYCDNNDSVETIINEIEAAIQRGETIDACEMTNDEWMELISSVRQDEDLLQYTVCNYENTETGMRAACFVDNADNPTDVNVVFRGTHSAYEWHDNGEGAYMTDTDQQLAAAQYVNTLPREYGNNITVSGHSKGGNKAQYVTITTERIGRCVSFDGQGFSKEFTEKYADEIAVKAGRITSISAEKDFVNCLLYPIAGTRKYVETEHQKNPLHNHKPNILLDDNGELRPQTEQSEFAKLINAYTTYVISTMDEPERSRTVDGLIAILEKSESEESALQTIYGLMQSGSQLDDFAKHYLWETGKTVGTAAGGYLNNSYQNFLDRIAGWGGTVIKVPLEQLQDHAQTLTELSDDNADIFQRIYDSLILVKENNQWQGSDLETVISVTESNKKKFEEAVKEMRALAKFLRNFTNEMAEKDEELKRRIISI